MILFWLASFLIHPPIGYQVQAALDSLSSDPIDALSPEKAEKKLSEQWPRIQVFAHIDCACGEKYSTDSSGRQTAQRFTIGIAAAKWLGLSTCDVRRSEYTSQWVGYGTKQIDESSVIEIEIPVPQRELLLSRWWHWWALGLGAVIGGTAVFIIQYLKRRTDTSDSNMEQGCRDIVN